MPKMIRLLARERTLLLILLGFFLLGGIYVAFTPPFEGPDEAQHFAYISWLTEGRGFPPQGAAAWDTPIEQEAGQPPLYYLLASLPARLTGLTGPTAVYQPNPHFGSPTPRQAYDNDNRAIHYPGEVSSLRGGWLTFYLARLLALAFGGLLVVAAYGLARQVTPDDRGTAVGAAFLVAFTPQVLYISSVASNDIPAAALSTVCLWLLAKLVRQGAAGPGLALAIGISLGLAALSKVSALVLAAPLGLALVWLWLGEKRPFPQIARTAVLIAAGFLLTAGWWFGRAWLLYGTPFGLEAHDYTPWAAKNPAAILPARQRWWFVFRSYWIALGWGTIRPPTWVDGVLAALVVTAVIGLALFFWRWRRGREDGRTAVLLLLLGAGLLGNVAFLELWMHRVIAEYGRLLFPSVAAIAVLLVVGWRAIHPKLSWLANGFVFAVAALAPFLLLRPAYAPELLTPTAVAALPPAIGWQFGPTADAPIAELISLDLLRTSVNAGEILPVRVCYRARQATDTDYTFLLHIIGPENSLIANRRSYPGHGVYPTSVWHAGDVLCDTLHVRLPYDLSQTLVYRVEFAMLDEARDERLPTFDAQGNPRPHNFITAVRVAAIDPPPAPIAVAEAGDPVQLVDFAVPAVWPRGQTVDLTLQWAANAPLTSDLQVFVHLRDPATGQNVAQADGPPANGWYPTSWWPVGEIVPDARQFAIPPDLAPGAYRLVVGLYDLDSGARVGAEQDLGVIQIEP